MNDTESTAYWVPPAVGDCTYAIQINDEYKSALKKDFTCNEEFKAYKEYVDTRLNNLKEAINNLRYSSSKDHNKGESHMMKKIKLVLVYGFAIFGLFTAVNNAILIPYKDDISKAYTYLSESFTVNFLGVKYHSEKWNTYSPKLKAKIWDSLNTEDRIELTDKLNTYAQKSHELKDFEKTFK